MKPKTFKQRAAEERDKIRTEVNEKFRESGEDDYFDPYSPKKIERESKPLSKSPAMKNYEPAIDSLLIAHRLRVIRETSFEEPWIADDYERKYIASITEEINYRLSSIPQQVYKIGELLHTAKKILGHGKFDEWFNKNFPNLSKSSALYFMRVYESCLGRPEILDLFKRSVLHEICAPKFPEDFRRFIFENIDGRIDPNKKDLLEVAVKWKKGEVTPKSPEVQSLLKKQRFKSEAKIVIEELRILLRHIKNSEKRIRAMNMISDPNPFLDEKDNDKDRRFIEIGDMVHEFRIAMEWKIKELTEDQ